MRKKPITSQDNEDDVQEVAPDSKRHKSSVDDLQRIRPAKVKKTSFADPLHEDTLLQDVVSDGFRDPSLAKPLEGNQFKTMEKVCAI